MGRQIELLHPASGEKLQVGLTNDQIYTMVRLQIAAAEVTRLQDRQRLNGMEVNEMRLEIIANDLNYAIDALGEAFDNWNTFDDLEAFLRKAEEFEDDYKTPLHSV